MALAYPCPSCLRIALRLPILLSASRSYRLTQKWSQCHVERHEAFDSLVSVAQNCLLPARKRRF